MNRKLKDGRCRVHTARPRANDNPVTGPMHAVRPGRGATKSQNLNAKKLIKQNQTIRHSVCGGNTVCPKRSTVCPETGLRHRTRQSAHTRPGADAESNTYRKPLPGRLASRLHTTQDQNRDAMFALHAPHQIHTKSAGMAATPSASLNGPLMQHLLLPPNHGHGKPLARDAASSR